ncbi:OB-fold nucleic acid binding domain-containing protein [Ornithinimicrobium sp. Arc0846-15]|nr:OB-fold nucleic acid binding domain-containing protein [Ornithinimicrobium laminariae]
MSVLTRAFSSWGRDQALIEADEVAYECARPGCSPIGGVTEGEMAQVTGTVHSMAVQPSGKRPELRVELYDGTAILELIWLGRRSIAGIAPGAYLTVSGRIAQHGDNLVMYNPGYDLLPARG